MSSPLPPLCRSPLESELPSPGSLWRPVAVAAPAVAPDLPVSPPLAGAFELPLLLDAGEELLELELALAPAFALAFAFAFAFAWLAELFDELVLIDWPPPFWVWSAPEVEGAGWVSW